MFLAVVIAFATALIIWRLPLLRSEHRLESVVSREATFLFNNLLLLALAFVILWGVVFPMLSEAVRGVRSTVSMPYYNFFLVAFGLPLLALTGIGPLIAWRRASPGSLGGRSAGRSCRRWRRGALLALLGAGVELGRADGVLAVRVRDVTIGLEFARGTSARRAIAGGSWPRALVDLVGRNRRRYGGYIVHLAIVLLVVGVAASGAYSHRPRGDAGAGPVDAAWPATRSPIPVWPQSKGPNSTTTSAPAGGAPRRRVVGTLAAGPRAVHDHRQRRSTNEVDIHTSARRRPLHDPRGRQRGRQRVTAQGAGQSDGEPDLAGRRWCSCWAALITIWPDPREARQLARRYAAALAREA